MIVLDTQRDEGGKMVLKLGFIVVVGRPDVRGGFSVLICVALWTVIWTAYVKMPHARLIREIWGGVRENLASGPPLDALRV